MTFDEIDEMISETGLPYSYHHFAEGENPEPPFILWNIPEDNNFSADNSVYFSTKQLEICLYTAIRNPETEHEVEQTLRNHKIFYTKNCTWIRSERLYEVQYDMEV